MANPNESAPEVTKPIDSKPPAAGERATQFVADAFRLVRLTKDCGVPLGEKMVPVGPIADAVAVRCALIAVAAHYNVGGSELVEASRLAAWYLTQGKAPQGER